MFNSFKAFAANVTSFGDTVQRYVEEHQAWDAFVISEHHLLQDGIDRASVKLQRQGLVSYWSPARATGNGGTSGGTMVAAKQWCRPTHLCPGWQQEAAAELPQFRDITPVMVTHGPARFLLISVYLTVGVGLAGNEAKIQHLVACARAHNIPWVAIGDWNCPPQRSWRPTPG